MKKVMIGILIIIPIVIVLVVAAVSQIVSMQAWIAVDDFSIKAKGSEEPFERLDIKWSEGEILDISEYIDIDIMPTRANAYTIQYTVVGDVEYFNHGYEQAYIDYINGDSDAYTEPGAYAIVDSGEANVNNVNTTGKFKINTVCAFSVGVVIEHLQKTIWVQATGEVPDKAELNVLKGDTELTVGESAILEASYDPPINDAKRTQWISSDPSVATVDGGVVKALAPGTADITVYSYFEDSEGEEHNVMSEPLTITVKAGASAKFGNSLTTSRNSVTLEELGISAADIDIAGSEGVQIEGNTVTFTAQTATLKTSNGTLNVEKCEQEDIAISGAELYGYDEDSERNYVLGIDEEPLKLSVVWRDQLKADSPAQLVWQSDNEQVATVNGDGVVTTVGSGIVTISAKIASAARAADSVASVRLNVRKKVSVLLLKTTEASLAIGLARETVFATNKYNDAMEVVENTVAVELMDAPADAAGQQKFYEDYAFSVIDGGEYAYFDEGSNVMHFTNKDGVYALEGKEKQIITVEVRAKYPKSYLYTRDYVKTVKLSVVYGISVVNIDQLRAAANAQDEYMRREGNFIPESTELIASLNGNNYYIKHAETSSAQLAIVLDADCAFKVGETHSANPINNFKGDVYGNSHMISSTTANCNWNYGMIGVGTSGVTLSNVIIRSNEVPEDSVIDAEDAMTFSGTPLWFGVTRNGDDKQPIHMTDNRVEYTIVENGGFGIRCYNSDTTFDGCVMRNTKSSGVYCPQHIVNPVDPTDSGKRIFTEGYVQYNHIEMHNVTSSNMMGCFGNCNYEEVTWIYDEAAKDGHYNRFYEDDARNAEFYVQNFVDKGYGYQFDQTGFLNIYNWQNAANARLIELQKEEYNQMIQTLIEPILKGNDFFKDVLYEYNDEIWFHMGFFVSGIMMRGNLFIYDEPTYPTMNMEDKSFYSLYAKELVPRKGLGLTSVAEQLISSLEFRIYGYDGTSKLTPASTYTLDYDFINSLHSEN